jgi:hypothetical protein
MHKLDLLGWNVSLEHSPDIEGRQPSFEMFAEKGIFELLVPMPRGGHGPDKDETGGVLDSLEAP